MVQDIGGQRRVRSFFLKHDILTIIVAFIIHVTIFACAAIGIFGAWKVGLLG